MSRYDDAFERLARQEVCAHKWLPRQQVRTSHGLVWRTECALCGRYLSRGDYGDLSQELARLETNGDS